VTKGQVHGVFLTNLKRTLKRYKLPQLANARLKNWRTKEQYQSLCRRYQTPSVLSDPAAIAALGRQLLDHPQACTFRLETGARPRVLFVGTDWEQDRSGILQAINALAEVTVFEHEPGKYGQRWPEDPRQYEAVRHHNARRLQHYLEGMERSSPVRAIIGQMWGLSMHWRALAAAKARGILVVNISMDDRHAYLGDRLVDGTWGGTRGLSSSLTLACTAAPECVRWHEADGCASIYLPEASDPEFFHPMAGPKFYDVCFVGANYGIRARMVHALERAGVRVQVYGSGWPNGRLPGDQVPTLFARSRIVLGCGTIGYGNDFLALKLRDFDAAMSGSLYVTHDNPDLQALFDVGREIMTFQDIPDMVAKVRYYLAHDQEREDVARCGRERVLREHTWMERFQRLLSCIGLKSDR
jgi:spore maturation protein CgeB